MSYFRSLPNIEYLSPFNDSPTVNAYVTAKNLFRRVKISESADIIRSAYLYDKYIVQEGERPDTVALKVYGNSELDWLVIFSANLIHQRAEWPLTSNELYEYAERKYGTSLNDIHHYETREVKDSDGRLILPKGKWVDSDFSIPDPNNTAARISPITSVTNFEYETELNDEKKQIDLVRPEYTQRIVEEIKEFLAYKPDSSQYISSKLKRVDNIKKKSP